MSPRPILVTGSHRSGTTWTGTLLGLSGEALPIHEPFNPGYPRSWLVDPPTRWFEYIPVGTHEPWQAQMQRLLDLRPPAATMFRRRPDARQLLRVAQEWWAARRARRNELRPLVKDPIAFFSAEWVSDSFDAQVVTLVRHPAAFASSLKRMDWRFDFANFADQPRLLDRLPAGQVDEIRHAVTTPLDIIDTAVLVWRVVNGVAATRANTHPDFVTRRYEDLAAAPVREFESLYGDLDLTWTPDVAAAVRAHTAADNDSTVADGDKGGVVRDSESAMWTWTDRLTDGEISRVRIGTADVAAGFYTDDDWVRPGG